MEELMTQFTGLGVSGIVAYKLFSVFLTEKKEDKETYKEELREQRELYRNELSMYREELSKDRELYRGSMQMIVNKLEALVTKLENLECEVIGIKENIDFSSKNKAKK